MAKKKRAARRKKTAAQSIGLDAADVSHVDADQVATLAARVAADGGKVLGRYRDPFGGSLVIAVVLPIDRVEPTPFQRDPSEPHVKRL